MRILILVLLVPLTPAAPAQPELWLQGAREFVRENPDNPGCEGLGHLVAALEQLNTAACVAQTESLRTIVQDGWRGSHPAVVDLIRSQAPALREAIAAAESESIAFPPAVDFESPVPNFLALQSMFRVLLADARGLEAAGDTGRAAQRAIQTLRLADHLCAEDVVLIQHLIGIAGMSMSLNTLESILANPRVTEEVLRAVGSELFRVDEGHVDVTAGLRVERRSSDAMLPQLREMVNDPARRGELADLFTDPKLAELVMSDLPGFEALANRYWDAVITNTERPAWERERMDEAWMRRLAGNPALLDLLPNFGEAGTRGDVVIARLRICQALCALRLGRPELVENFTDPFTGQPLRVLESHVWSLGPDRTDQLGREQYDPTNGTVSAGDIVAAR